MWRILAPLLVFLALLALREPASGERARRVATAADRITNAPQVLLPAVPSRTLTFCVIQGGASAEQLIFRGVGGSPVYATVSVAAGAVIGRAMSAAIPAGGLEVVTSDAAGDVTVECTYRLGS